MSYLSLKGLLISALIATSAYAQTSYFVVNLNNISGDGIVHIDPYKIKVQQGFNRRLEIPIIREIKSLKSSKIWIRAVVKSARDRSAVYFNNGEAETFSYHSGDGTAQLILSQSDIPKKISVGVLSLLSSEKGVVEGEVEFGPIIISKPETPIPEELGVSTKNWARTNNPDPKFWFDRYTSQLRDFTVTLPHEGYPTWERYFGIGVNDRFNKGDYFCFPDDSLYITNYSNLRYWAYLGVLPWKRKIVEKDGKLDVLFEYEGLLKPAADYNPALNIQGSGPKHFNVPEDIFVKLKKNYSFSTDKSSSVVTISAEVSGAPERFKFKWTIQDAAFMDFTKGNSIGVYSLLNGKREHGGAILDVWEEKNNKRFEAIQYRLDPGGQSLATNYYAPDAEIKYVLPIDRFAAFFDAGYVDMPGLLTADIISLNVKRPKPEIPWMFGVGFRSDSNGKLSRSLKRIFVSRFKDVPEMLKKIHSAQQE